MSQIPKQTRALDPSFGAASLNSAWPLFVCVLLAAGTHFWLAPRIGQFNTRILMDIGIAMMLAVSLNIVNGFTGQFSIGHAGFLVVGGYAAGFVTHYGSLMIWGDTETHGGLCGSGDQLFLMGCLLGGVAAAIAGFIVGLPSMRLGGDYLAIVTLGFGEIIRVLLQQTNDVLFTTEQVRAATFDKLFPPPVGGSIGFEEIPTYTNPFWVVLFATITIVTSYRLKQSSTGRALVSIREDEIAAQAMGINVTRLKVSAFVISAFFAGIAGGLFAHESGIQISPNDAGFQRSFDLVIMTVLGGMGSISGAVLAATVLTILPEALRGFAQYRLIVFALLLIVVMIARPQGLFGFREIWDYLPGPLSARRKAKASA